MNKSILDELTELLKNVKEPSCLVIKPELFENFTLYEVPFEVIDLAMKMYNFQQKQKDIEPECVDIVNRNFGDLV